MTYELGVFVNGRYAAPLEEQLGTEPLESELFASGLFSEIRRGTGTRDHLKIIVSDKFSLPLTI